MSEINSLSSSRNPEAYSEPIESSKMKTSAKVFAESSTINVWLGSEYVSGITAVILEITKKASEVNTLISKVVTLGLQFY